MTQLVIEHIREDKMPHLYGPQADWRSADAYPAVKPDHEWEAADHLRLAWEILRRIPRYRWHFERVQRSGLLGARSFKGATYYFAAQEGHFFRVPGWEQIVLNDHYCNPPEHRDQTLESYVDQHSGTDWVVVFGPRWATNLWGIADLVDPIIDHSKIDLKAFFSPSAPSLISPRLKDGIATSVHDPKSRFVEGALVGREPPLRYSTIVDPREVLVRLRLDMPIAPQMEMTKLLFNRGKDATKLSSVGNTARFTDVGLASFWLRAWDASKEASRDKLPFGRTDLMRHLERTVWALPKAQLDQSAGNGTFADELHRSLAESRIDKWLAKADTYIKTDHDMYRKAVAAGLSKSQVTRRSKR